MGCAPGASSRISETAKSSALSFSAPSSASTSFSSIDAGSCSSVISTFSLVDSASSWSACRCASSCDCNSTVGFCSTCACLSSSGPASVTGWTVSGFPDCQTSGASAGKSEQEATRREGGMKCTASAAVENTAQRPRNWKPAAGQCERTATDHGCRSPFTLSSIRMEDRCHRPTGHLYVTC